MIKRNIKFVYSGGVLLVLLLTGFVSYNIGRHDGAKSASIYFGALTLGSNSLNAALVAKGEEERFFDILEETFREYPALKEMVEKEPVHFGEKIELHPIEHYLKVYYETRGKEIPDEIAKSIPH